MANQLGSSLEAVNEALVRLRDRGDRCMALARPYADEPRIVVTVVDGETLTRVAWRDEPERATTMGMPLVRASAGTAPGARVPYPDGYCTVRAPVMPTSLCPGTLQ